MEDDITDRNTLSQKYILVLKAFVKNKSSGIPKNPDNRFYVEISEVRKKIKKIAFACVLQECFEKRNIYKTKIKIQPYK